MGEPFCDWATVSVPKGDTLARWDRVRSLLLTTGCHADTLDLVRSEGGGVFRHAKQREVEILSISGAAMGYLRALDLVGDVFSMLGEGAHRVTRGHLTVDTPKDTHSATVTHLKRIYSVGKSGRVSLGRKRVPRERVVRVWGPTFDGLESGTVYFNDHQAGVHYAAAVYDKQWERIKAGYGDPGPLVRTELKLGSQAGLSLRDLADPVQAFWHYCPPEFLKAPGFVSPWHKRPDEGFPRVAKVRSRLTDLQGFVEHSGDLHHLVNEALELMPTRRKAYRLALTLLRKSFESQELLRQADEAA